MSHDSSESRKRRRDEQGRRDEFDEVKSALDPVILNGGATEIEKHLSNENSIIKQRAAILRRRIEDLEGRLIDHDEEIHGLVGRVVAVENLIDRRADSSRVTNLETKVDRLVESQAANEDARKRLAAMETLIDRLEWGGKKLWIIFGSCIGIVVAIIKGADWLWKKLNP